MATLKTNITNSIQYWEDIKQAVITKGGTVPEGTPVSEYASKILQMPAGTYTGGKTTGWIEADLTQDNTPYYFTTNPTTVTPSIQWTITEKEVNTSTMSVAYTFNPVSEPNRVFSTFMSSGMYPTGKEFIYSSANMLYSDWTSNKHFAAYSSYVSSTTQYSYRLYPTITVPSDFVVTDNTVLCVQFYGTLTGTSPTYTFKIKSRYCLIDMPAGG